MPIVDDVHELQERDWSDTLTHEVRRIRRWPAIDPASLSVSVDNISRLRIGFITLTDQLVESGPNLIEWVEPVTLVYKSIDAVGLNAPAVWSGRSDFPRHIGHINPTPADQPVSLCLARAGLQPVYDRYGIDGVIDRLLNWLHDAKTGQLMMDGWEPVPIGEGQDLRGAFFDIATFQKMAATCDASGGWQFGVARLLKEEFGGKVVFLSPQIELTNAVQVQQARTRIEDPPNNELGVATYIPWLFVWSDITCPIDNQLFGVWNTYGEIEAGLKESAIGDLLPSAIMDCVLNLTDPDTPGGKPIGLLVGVWRPVPISNKVFGMAPDADARRLEIRAYLLHCEKHRNNPIDPAIEAQQLLGIQLPNREMLAFTSRVSVQQPVALFGCGALGSIVGDCLLRVGIPQLAVFDYDDIAPHNFARHNATIEQLHLRKVDHMATLARNLTFFDNEIKCTPIHHDVTTLSDDTIAQIGSEYKFIIDATASEKVRRRLATVTLPPPTQLVRAELLNDGHLGVLFVAGVLNNPNMVDLYYALCLLALDNDPVEHWLREEQAEVMLPRFCGRFTVWDSGSFFDPPFEVYG